MSKLLEIIEKEIQDTQKEIKEFKKQINETNDNDDIECYKSYLKECEDALLILQQIKTILKGWYSLKNKITFQRGEFIPHLLAIKKGHTALTYLEYKDIEKALEVKDE